MNRWTSPVTVALIAAFAMLLVAPASRSQGNQVAVRIIAFNDFHGHLEPGENVVELPDPSDPARTRRVRAGGAAHLATLVARLRAEHPQHVVVSSGDLVGASPLISGLFHDEPTIEVMNAIGIDFNTVGNHEFDHGVDELKRLVKGGCKTAASPRKQSCMRLAYAGARFPFLAANVLNRSDDQPIFAPAFVKTIDGVRVGFIGVVTRSTPGIVVPSGVAGVRFVAEARVLNEQAKVLQAQGVQAIVAVVHEGGDADGGFNDCANPRGAIFEIERELDAAIDVVLSAHTHQGYNCSIGGRPVIQGASFGRLVSVVDVGVDRTTGDVVRAQTRARNVPVVNGAEGDPRIAADFPPVPADPTVAAIVEAYRDAAAPLANRPVGRIAAPFERRPGRGGDHALGRLIADAHLAATRGSGAEVAFTNPGGIRASLHASGRDGTVTYADAYAAQPFGNSLVTMTLTGAQLKTLLEQQWSVVRPEHVRILQPSAGFTYRWDSRRPHGSRVSDMRLNGRLVDADGRGARDPQQFPRSRRRQFPCAARRSRSRRWASGHRCIHGIPGGRVDASTAPAEVDAPDSPRRLKAAAPLRRCDNSALSLQELRMRRTRAGTRARQSADAATLVKMTRRLSESGSRIEDQLWQRRLIELINERLARRNDDAIESALDELASSSQRAYDDLADLAESCAESTLVDVDGRPHDVLLLALPMLAWSRYRLPTTTLSAGVIENLTAHLAGHLLARDTRVAIADQMYSIDQLPEAFSDVRRLTEQLGDAAVERVALHVDPKKLREPIAMLADTRYVLAAVATPAGGPLFHWQELGVDPDAKIEALAAFREQVANVLQPVMTGCRFRVLSPNAFHAALRFADRELREFSLEAAVAYLKLSYDFSPGSLSAAYGIFADPNGQSGAEVRVGLAKSTDEDEVVEGVVWPLLGDEEEQTMEEVEKALRAVGVVKSVAHSHRFPLEFCDDCGAPLFPTAAGHVVHAEPPEEAEDRPATPLH